MNELFKVLWKGFFPQPHITTILPLHQLILRYYTKYICRLQGYYTISCVKFFHLYAYYKLANAQSGGIYTYSPKWLKSPAVHLQNGLRDPFLQL